MNIIETQIKDLIIIEPRVFTDNRGYFFESYNQKIMENSGLKYNFIQDNQSFSTFGTIRGLHLQTGEYAQAKLVRVIQGEVLDVAIDLRPNSETFGKSYSIKLSGENHKQFLIPRGFAHGFSVLSETAVFSYKCDNLYNKESEAGIKYDDSELAIDWKVPQDKVKVSEKDLLLPSFDSYKQGLK